MINFVDIKTADHVGSVEVTTFSDGAISVKLPEKLPRKNLGLWVDPATPVALVRDLMEQTFDALEEQHITLQAIYMPYLPYARADRVFEKGNSLPLRVFVDWVDYALAKYDLPRITILDPHNFNAIPTHMQGLFIVEHLADYVEQEDYSHITSVIAPDYGSIDRALLVAEKLGVKVSAYGSKTRYISNGRLTGYTLEVTSEVGLQPLVVDDICDGGGTFLLLHDALKQHDKDVNAHLLLSFGIFSKGKELLESKYRSVTAIYDFTEE